MRYAISGASRGIGLEFVRQLLARGDTVEAGARNPSEAEQLAALARDAGHRLRIHALDVTNTQSVRAFAAAVADTPIDVLINNAGVGGKWTPLADMDFEDLAYAMETNAIGPMRLSSALISNVLKGSTRKIVHLSTRMSSMTENTPAGYYGFAGGAYPYRMSKAALNAGMRSMAVDFHEQGLITAVLHPGWVQTDLGGKTAPTSAEEAVKGLLRVIDGLTLANSGRFLDFEGHEIPW